MSSKSFQRFLMKQEAAAAHKRALVQISEERLAKTFNPAKPNEGQHKEDAWLSTFSTSVSFSVKKRPMSVHDKVGPNSPASAAASPLRQRRPATALGRMEGDTVRDGDRDREQNTVAQSRDALFSTIGPRIAFHKYSDAFEERAAIALQNRLKVLRGATPDDWYGKQWQEGAVMTPLLDRDHPMFSEFKQERKKLIGIRPVSAARLQGFVERQEMKNQEKVATVTQRQDEQIRTAIKPPLCQRGHKFEVIKDFKAWTCSQCGTQPEGVKQHRHCSICEYNLCKLCFIKKLGDEEKTILSTKQEKELLERIGAEAAQQHKFTLLREITTEISRDLGFEPFGKSKVVRYGGRNWRNFLERQRQSAKQRFSRKPYHG